MDHPRRLSDIGSDTATQVTPDYPGVHAIYAEYEALIRIDDGMAIRGELPRTAARLVEQWRQLHQSELNANWELAQQPSALTSIEPLQ
jgi:hypothetical protein